MHEQCTSAREVRLDEAELADARCRLNRRRWYGRVPFIETRLMKLDLIAKQGDAAPHNALRVS